MKKKLFTIVGTLLLILTLGACSKISTPDDSHEDYGNYISFYVVDGEETKIHDILSFEDGETLGSIMSRYYTLSYTEGVYGKYITGINDVDSGTSGFVYTASACSDEWPPSIDMYKVSEYETIIFTVYS